MEVKIPSVGESVTSGLISVWHKKDGEYVESGEILLTIDTDKVSTEIPADASGILHIKAEEGEEVDVGQVVAEIEPGERPADDEESSPKSQEKPAVEEGKAPAEEDAPADARDRSGYGGAKEPADDQRAQPDPGSTDPGRLEGLSPAVRRLVEENELNPADIEGSGRGGRITKQDVEAHLAARKADTRPRETAKQPAAAREDGKAAAEPVREGADKTRPGGANAHRQSAPAAEGERTTRKTMSPLRRKIAQALVNAQNNAAHLTTFNEADMSAVMAMRKRYQDDFVKQNGIKLGFMSFFIKAVVEALKTVPQINARIDGEDIIYNNFYDIGVAVGTERGLVVPVIRDCDKKSFAELEQDILDYAKKARDGKITLEDLQGGCFTISNGGIYGSMLSTPILNPPQSGILGMHNIQERPVAIEGEVVIRPMMYVALSYDHRVVDGKEAVTFLVKVKQCIEDPARMAIGV